MSLVVCVPSLCLCAQLATPLLHRTGRFQSLLLEMFSALGLLLSLPLARDCCTRGTGRRLRREREEGYPFWSRRFLLLASYLTMIPVLEPLFSGIFNRTTLYNATNHSTTLELRPAYYDIMQFHG